MFSADMTPERFAEAAERQRQIDLAEARSFLNFYKRRVEELEARDPLNRVSTAAE